MKSKSNSVMTGDKTPIIFTANKSGKQFYLPTIGFMTSIIRVFVISKKTSDFLKFRFLLKSSHYVRIDSPHWFNEDL